MRNIEFNTSEGILTLLAIKGLGAAYVRKIVERFPDLEALRAAEDSDFKGVTTTKMRDILRSDDDTVEEAHGKARREIEDVREVGADVICYLDDHFPEQLHHIPDSPLVLRACGELGILKRAIAFVGARDASQFGQIATQRMAGHFAERNWTIVSGLARGVDQISHQAALDAGKPTVAVIGSGIDTYRSEAELVMAEKITAEGGLVLTEQPCQRDADASSLITRNRLITGLSVATFVMQAAKRSGTMHSVRYAVRQRKPIYTPGIPEKFRSEPLNEVPRLLAEMNGSDFVRWAEFKESDVDEVDEREEMPLATSISGRESYDQVETELNIMMPDAPAPDDASLPKVA